MRFKSASMFTFIALLTVCGFLFDASGAAAAGERIQSKDPNGPVLRSELPSLRQRTSMPRFFATGGIQKGGQGLPAFMKEVTDAQCSSGCCWASGCNVSCSESRCFASCGSETAEYNCSAK